MKRELHLCDEKLHVEQFRTKITTMTWTIFSIVGCIGMKLISHRTKPAIRKLDYEKGLFGAECLPICNSPDLQGERLTIGDAGAIQESFLFRN